MTNLITRKQEIENLITSLQQELLHINNEIEKENDKSIKESALLMEFEKNGGMIIINKHEDVKKDIETDIDSLDLTNKEKTVLQAIIDNSYEIGLGIESSDLDCTIKGKSLSGVISSLTKKGYVKSYMDGESIGHDAFFNLTDEWFNKLVLTGE